MGNIIRLNSAKLNTEVIGCAGACDDMLHRAPSIPTTPPEFPELPDIPEPDVPDTPVEPEPTTYTLIAEVANGVVSAKLNGVAVQLPYTATEGDIIVLEVTPAEGYEFASWMDGNTENPRTITILSNVTLSASCEVETPTNPDVDANGYIIFEDAEVAQICADNWGDGTGITLEQAAAVTSIGTVFRGNTTITSFNEFKHFTSVTTISEGSDSLGGGLANCSNLEYITLPPLVMCGKNAFRRNTKLKIAELPASLTDIEESAFCEIMSAPEDIVLPDLISLGAKAFKMVGGIKKVLDLGAITVIQGGGALATNSSPFYGCADVELFIIPPSVTSLGKGAISYMSSLKCIVSKPEVPPVYGESSLTSLPALSAIYVPDASVAAYREASGWKTYASRIFPVSQLQTDNPELYAEIEEYL